MREICTVDDCGKHRVPGRAGYCAMHLWRVRKYGSLELPPRREPRLDPTGYAKRHHEWVHRIVLRAVIGDEPHPCHWCNRMLAWGVDLWVDHVDGVRSNNDPHNLVPACSRCNTWRSRTPSTHCKHGHEFTPENTYVNAASGSRVCRACSSEYKREWQRARRREKKAATASA